MGTLRVMSRRGDDTITWEKAQVEAGDPEAAAAVREAERIFRDQQGRGGTAYRLAPGKTPVRIDEFDVEADQIVVIPRVVGG
jgi:hypothetical protein